MALANRGSTEYPLELAGVVEPGVPREPLVVRLQGGFKRRRWGLPSGRQTLAAFGTARIQNLAPTSGRHTRSKPVVAFAFQVAGLKGSLHRSLPLVRFCPTSLVPAVGRCQSSAGAQRGAKFREAREASQTKVRRIIYQFSCSMNVLKESTAEWLLFLEEDRAC
jgi:hypothetical protein